MSNVDSEDITVNKISTTCNALCKLLVSTASYEMITLCSAT